MTSRFRKKTKAAGGSKKGWLLKRLISQAVIWSLIAGFFIAAALLLTSLSEGQEKSMKDAESAKLKAQSDLKTLEEQLEDLEFALPLKERIIGDDGLSTIDLNRNTATDIFLKLKDKYAFGGMKVTISSITKEEDDKLKATGVWAINSIINIEMKAFHDEQVVSFLKDIKSQLNGVVSVEDLSVKRGQNYTLDQSIQSRDPINADPQLDVSIRLLWRGMELEPPKKEEES